MRRVVLFTAAAVARGVWFETLIEDGILPPNPVSGCEDDDGWYSKKAAAKDCAWVADDPEARCADEQKIKAEDACERTCTGAGADDDAWYMRKASRNCEWVGKSPAKVAKFCKRKGKIPASAACGAACDVSGACGGGFQYHCHMGAGNGVDGKYEFGTWDPACAYTTVMSKLENPAGCAGADDAANDAANANCASTCLGSPCFQPDCAAVPDHACCQPDCTAANEACGVYPYANNPVCQGAGSGVGVSGDDDESSERADGRIQDTDGTCAARNLVDDPNWAKKDKPHKHCGWVQKKPLERCDSENAAGETGWDGCKCSCQTLEPTEFMHAWEELVYDLPHEKAGPIVSIPTWARIRFMTPASKDGLSALHFHNLIAGNQFLGASFYYNYDGEQWIGRDVITASGEQFIHLFSNILFGSCDGGQGCHEEDYQWLFHINSDIAPVSADDPTPCPSEWAARMGECLVIDVPYLDKYTTQTQFHENGLDGFATKGQDHAGVEDRWGPPSEAP